MSNSASFTIFTHTNVKQTLAQQVALIQGLNTSTAVTLTSATVPQSVFIEKVAMSVDVQVTTYSYDGLVFTDSYWSDS